MKIIHNSATSQRSGCKGPSLPRTGIRLFNKHYPTRAARWLRKWQKSQAAWMKICDVTLDKGPRETKSMLALLFEIAKPDFGSKPCPYCDTERLDLSLFHHLMETHPHDYVHVQDDPVKISQLLVGINSDSDIFM